MIRLIASLVAGAAIVGVGILGILVVWFLVAVPLGSLFLAVFSG